MSVEVYEHFSFFNRLSFRILNLNTKGPSINDVMPEGGGGGLAPHDQPC